MARKLSDLKLRNDVDGKQLRCLIVEDYQTGSVSKIRDRHRFEEVLKETDEMFLTKVYEPTSKQREELLNTLKVHDRGGENIEIPEKVVLFHMLQFTDLELDSTSFEENEALLDAIISNPNPLFLSIKNELDLIFIEAIAMLIDINNSYRQMPEEWLDVSNQIMATRETIKKQETKKTRAKKQIKKIEEKIEKAERDLVDTVQ